ncbi:MAG: hypothetical protein KGH99_06910 [Thaumarchaeota archaeon]|nr:hypothetical protein [Nitrososphaerota archaeon]
MKSKLRENFKIKKLGTTTAFLFEKYVIVGCLSIDWIQLFSGLPVFDVMIDKYGKLHFVSQRNVIQ